MLFRSRWTFRGNIVEVVPYYKYFGAFFTSTLSWNKTKETLSQASKAVVNILKYQKQFDYFFANEALKLFDSIVVPIVCYSADLCGYQYTECIERVQSNFCKRLCCLKIRVVDCAIQNLN